VSITQNCTNQFTSNVQYALMNEICQFVGPRPSYDFVVQWPRSDAVNKSVKIENPRYANSVAESNSIKIDRNTDCSYRHVNRRCKRLTEVKTEDDRGSDRRRCLVGRSGLSYETGRARDNDPRWTSPGDSANRCSPGGPLLWAYSAGASDWTINQKHITTCGDHSYK